jgi:hypothetical protein
LNQWLAFGSDDLVLVNKNTIGYINRIFIPSGKFDWEGYLGIDPSNLVWAEGTIYDPTDFEGDVKADIAYVRGLLKNGSRPPISGVVDAMWDAQEIAREILAIEGGDITLAPSFKNAAIRYVKLIK